MPVNRQFRLMTQHPTPKEIGIGVFNVDQKTADASFWEGQAGADGSESRQLATLARSRLDSAAAHGIMLSGMEPAGGGKFRYQEWWLAYI
jgi:hypothetical protein